MITVPLSSICLVRTVLCSATSGSFVLFRAERMPWKPVTKKGFPGIHESLACRQFSRQFSNLALQVPQKSTAPLGPRKRTLEKGP